jgi:hypothetical protein
MGIHREMGMKQALLFTLVGVALAVGTVGPLLLIVLLK